MPQQSLEKASLILKYLDVDNMLNSLNLPNLNQADKETIELIATLIKAIKQHEEYIQNLIKFINGEIEWDPPSYTKCKFGQSYYKIDIEKLQKYGDEVVNLFKRIGALHVDFH
ncbi:MAG: CZB domain-containing protein, partial [Hydrogenobaculum sp.]